MTGINHAPKWGQEHSTATRVITFFDQAERRDADRLPRRIVVVDCANHQLDCLAQEAARRGVSIDIIVDFIHVPYLR